ncbi:MAG TPA: AEC family transporter, partial [Methanocellaceae archaeon]
KALNKDALNALSKLIVMIILPALIFSIIAGSGVTVNDFLNNGAFAVGVGLCYTLLIISGIVMSRLLGLEGKTANIYMSLATFGNMGFMGIPLLLGIFKDPVVQVCIAVYTVIDMALLWTYGVYLCSKHQDNSNPLSAVKNIINPTTVALAIAIIVMAVKFPVPGLLMGTISGVGNTSKYLTLIYIGGVLAYVSVSKISAKVNILVLTVVKMLALPVFVFILLGFFLPLEQRTILTLIVGLPGMTTIAMIASNYQSDVEYATEIIFVTTLASLVTIPLLFITMSIL